MEPFVKDEIEFDEKTQKEVEKGIAAAKNSK